MNRVVDVITAHGSLIAAYVVVACLLGIISLVSTWRRPREISPVLFFIGHALWPITLALIVIAASRAPRD